MFSCEISQIFKNTCSEEHLRTTDSVLPQDLQNLGGVYLYKKKTSRLQPDQPTASVSWDNFNFRLHEQFRPGLQG